MPRAHPPHHNLGAGRWGMMYVPGEGYVHAAEAAGPQTRLGALRRGLTAITKTPTPLITSARPSTPPAPEHVPPPSARGAEEGTPPDQGATEAIGDATETAEYPQLYVFLKAGCLEMHYAALVELGATGVADLLELNDSDFAYLGIDGLEGRQLVVVANEALKRDRMRRVHISPAAVDPVQSGRWTAPTSHLQTLRCTTRTDGAEQSSAPARTRSRRGWLLQHRRRISEVADAAGMTVEDVLTITQKLSEEQLDEFIERLGEPWIAPHGTGSGPHRRPFHAIQFERLAREERDRAIFEWIRHHGSQRAWSESDLRRQERRQCQ